MPQQRIAADFARSRTRIRFPGARQRSSGDDLRLPRLVRRRTNHDHLSRRCLVSQGQGGRRARDRGVPLALRSRGIAPGVERFGGDESASDRASRPLSRHGQGQRRGRRFSGRSQRDDSSVHVQPGCTHCARTGRIHSRWQWRVPRAGSREHSRGFTSHRDAAECSGQSETARQERQHILQHSGKRPFLLAGLARPGPQRLYAHRSPVASLVVVDRVRARRDLGRNFGRNPGRRAQSRRQLGARLSLPPWTATPKSEPAR